ncbi:cation diffusion facilitator family transporter [Marinimicrobium sp. ARAG 43.8]|uniref:cation diffusion facilitator family transporter n=1 Tax=Marinimicrobium sp. ARAG 43.8 TaxID=3418719 RepID=UPI003CED9C0C
MHKHFHGYHAHGHHSHSHGDHHQGNGSSRRIAWAFFLNLGFTVIEFIGGLLTNSTAIMADAVHDLGDSLSIGLSWVLAKFSGREASGSFTYGYRRFSLLGALINGLVLVAGSLWVLAEALPRLVDPQMPVVEGMLGLAVFGVTVNGYAAYKLSEGKTLNERVLNWHLLEDVLGWLAVLVVSVVMLFVDWPILDPLLSIGFTLFILINVARNFWETVRLFLQATPSPETRAEIERALEALPGVCGIHHLHFWSLDGEHHVLTAHLSVSGLRTADEVRLLKERVSVALADYDLAHTTVELELEDEQCRDVSGARVPH